MKQYSYKYRAEHYDELLLKKRIYREIHREELRDKQRKYLEKNRIKSYAKVKEWRDKNKLYLRKYFSRYFFLNPQPKRKYIVPILQKVYENNIKEFGTLTCIYCFVPIPFGKDTIDHLNPISQQGLSDYDNMVIACKCCNSTKGDKNYNEFGNYMINNVKKFL